MSTERVTPESGWNLVWRDIVEEDGEVQLDRVKGLLHDYGILLHGNSLLYPFITDDRIIDPQHDVEEVIDVAEQVALELANEIIQTVLNDLYVTLEDVYTEPEEIQLRALIGRMNDIYAKTGQTE